MHKKYMSFNKSKYFFKAILIIIKYHNLNFIRLYFKYYVISVEIIKRTEKKLISITQLHYLNYKI